MENIWDLYMRYDGPLPAEGRFHTSPACWEMMMQRHLRLARIKRHQNAWRDLPELTARINEIRVHLSSHIG